MTYDRDMFYLSSKNRDRLIRIMDYLKGHGCPTDNKVMILVLRAMRDKGLLPKSDNKEMIELIKKIVPKGGKILHIKGDDNGRQDQG